MSSRKRSGSRYSKKIDIKYFIVSYEGGEDEKSYFESLKDNISRQFENLVFFTPVEKSNVHHSSPEHVLRDLEAKASSLNYRFKNDNVFGFIAFDVDHYFSNNHQKATKSVIREAKQKDISLLISNPSFDVWPLLHFENIVELDNDTQNAIKSNANQFLKKRLKFVLSNNNINLANLINYTEVALQNNQRLAFDLSDPPKKIGSSMNLLLEQISPFLIKN